MTCSVAAHQSRITQLVASEGMRGKGGPRATLACRLLSTGPDLFICIWGVTHVEDGDEITLVQLNKVVTRTTSYTVTKIHLFI